MVAGKSNLLYFFSHFPISDKSYSHFLKILLKVVNLVNDNEIKVIKKVKRQGIKKYCQAFAWQ
jgi:hypothetical protein